MTTTMVPSSVLHFPPSKSRWAVRLEVGRKDIAMSKYGNKTSNWFEAVVNKLGGEEGADQFLRGETAVRVPDRSWREQDGVIYFTVISDGTIGQDWIPRLEGKGMRLSDDAKSVLRSSDFKPTKGVIYEVAVLKGMLFNDSERVTKKIRIEAEQRTLSTPNAEIGCLIRDKFSDEEIKAMGLAWIVTMHDPIAASDGNQRLLSADRYGGGFWLSADWVGPGYKWRRRDGFTFVVSQVIQS